MPNLTLPDFTSPDMWLSFLLLTFLEIVLGIDNIIFISIVAGRLPREEQKKARQLGLTLALVFRIALLLTIGWIMTLTEPIFTLDFIKQEDKPLGISVKDLILIGGGLFLMYKSVKEIHHKLEGEAENVGGKQYAKLSYVIFQIVMVDMVFSFDSILTAIGMTKEVSIMIMAVIISVGVMMLFAKSISDFVNRHPTMQMLALAFLILIGIMLVAEGFHQNVSKGYIYFAIAFSLTVEVLNMRLRRKKRHVVHLNEYVEAE